MIKKGMLSVAFAAAAVLAFGGVASAEYGAPTVITVVQGETITVSGDGCLPGSNVSFAITSGNYDQGVGNTTADSDGAYDTTVTVPLNAPVGAADATATCEGPNGTVTKVLGLNIVAATPVTTGTLARTGSDNTQTLVGVGAGFLLLGGTLAIGARRTRRTVVA